MSINAFRVNQDVIWTPDGSEGVVVRVLEGQAVCIHWFNERLKDFWYSAWSGSLDRIEIVGFDEQREAA